MRPRNYPCFISQAQENDFAAGRYPWSGRATRFKCDIKNKSKKLKPKPKTNKQTKKSRSPSRQEQEATQVNSTATHLQRARSGFGWHPM